MGPLPLAASCGPLLTDMLPSTSTSPDCRVARFPRDTCSESGTLNVRKGTERHVRNPNAGISFQGGQARMRSRAAPAAASAARAPAPAHLPYMKTPNPDLSVTNRRDVPRAIGAIIPHVGAQTGDPVDLWPQECGCGVAALKAFLSALQSHFEGWSRHRGGLVDEWYTRRRTTVQELVRNYEHWLVAHLLPTVQGLAAAAPSWRPLLQALRS